MPQSAASSSLPESHLPNQDRLRLLEQICVQHQVATLYAFGSRSREAFAWLQGAQHALTPCASDLDIGARPVPGVRWSVAEKVRLAISLEDLFDCARVDLVVLPEADLFVAAEVIRGERLWARDDYEADEYDLYVLRRAGDLAPWERERIELVLRGRP
jgi:predicted nucleotidyltransferase